MINGFYFNTGGQDMNRKHQNSGVVVTSTPKKYYEGRELMSWREIILAC